MDAPAARRRQLLFIAAIIVGAVMIAIHAERSGGDLAGFHAVWAANWQHAAAENRPDPEDPYAPSFYVLFAPLGAIPLWAAAAVMFLMNIACACGIVRMTIALLDIPRSDQWLLWIPAVGVAPFFFGTLSLGQNTLILMCLVLGAYTLVRRESDFCGGCLIGLATAIKIYPILFLVPFALRMRWKVVSGCGATVVLIAGGLGTLFLGYETNLQWHESWGRFVTRADQDVPEDPAAPRTMRCTARYNNQAVHAVLARLMMDVPAKWYGDTFHVNLLSCDAATWRRTRTATTLLFAGLGIVALLALRQTRRRIPSRMVYEAEQPRELSRDAREFALVCSWFFLVSPMVWTHYLVWAYFPLACVAVQRSIRPRRATIILAAWFAAECLVGSQFSRAIGVNLWAGLLLFGWFAVPCVRDAVAGWTRVGRSGDQGPIPLFVEPRERIRRRAA